jgi:hypothetical protein
MPNLGAVALWSQEEREVVTAWAEQKHHSQTDMPARPPGPPPEVLQTAIDKAKELRSGNS